MSNLVGNSSPPTASYILHVNFLESYLVIYIIYHKGIIIDRWKAEDIEDI